ncbi:DsbA family protein [Parerythrobacter jejuensis]|uniref:Thioredoxin domain-containing protein n=1 Tax=Parerythrobacter jejuensis TaxID=795812 RepID=A0A845AWE0_9SPHN|nr:thioredoxin domain-containing protein [Parerythrobacter jejuensis]MXP32826.1 thioredoxin domain-containing protein [Parerythrobacter jejuensis]
MIASRRLSASVLALAAFAVMGAGKNWVTEVERTDVSHIIGNPEAELQLTEFISYTCPACGAFSRQGEEIVKLAYVGPGKAKLEIRHVQRNVVDITATMLAWCGPKEKFLRNHVALMFAQDKWLAKLDKVSDGQRRRWFSGPEAQRRKAVASDLGFYDIFEQRGYGRVAIDRCLSDQAMAERQARATADDATTYFVTSTPAFAIDGVKLTGTSSWEMLEPQLNARF